MDAELPLSFDAVNEFIVKQMLAESSKSVPKALLYEGIDPVEKVLTYFLSQMTESSKSNV